MSMNDGTSGPQAVLNFPRLDKLLIAFAKGILLALTGNKNFLNPSPSLIAFKVDIDAYDTAETLAGTNAKGTATQRNARRRKVIEDLRHLRDYVQSIVELQLNATDAAAMITTAGMRVRKVGKRFKAPLRARNAGISGTVLLDAKVVARLATYYWQYSVDQKVWMKLASLSIRRCFS